MNSNV